MKFLLTKELGRLARWLRILGFDSDYFTGNNFSSLIIQALRDNRTIITRNHHLPKAGGIKIIVLKAEALKSQLKETLEPLDISIDANLMFTRCIICNQKLIEIDKERVKDKVPEYVYKTQEDFITCPQCKRIYWQGTHWGNVQSTLKKI